MLLVEAYPFLAKKKNNKKNPLSDVLRTEKKDPRIVFHCAVACDSVDVFPACVVQLFFLSLSGFFCINCCPLQSLGCYDWL